MVRTVSISTSVPKSREVRLFLPGDFPLGPAELLVVVATKAPAPLRTLGDLLRSEFFGMWSHRKDLGASRRVARRLRRKAWGSRP